ncbi:MAG: DUF4384 domain-containing protein [Prevotella sp.]|nr:DUF4384 domain-containing protein [Prevotella sp.]
MRFWLIIVIFLTFPATFFAQQVKKVVGTYTYYAPEDISLDRAKRTALERAQLEAIAETFGTDISQHNSTRVSNKNGHSDIDFLSISSSDIKGEWIETIGEPEYSIKYDRGMLVVECTVKGNVREILSAVIDIKAKILRNGTEDRFESSEFHSGDDMFLSFQSPVDGFLAVYLLDDNGDAFCLLPYRNQTDGIQKVSANKPYVFFSEKDVPLSERGLVDEYTLTSEHSIETNQIYVVFSPNAFVKANDNDMGDFLPREIDGKNFQKWLAKVRRKDKYVNFNSKQITITKE